jgi:hypothetical protein
VSEKIKINSTSNKTATVEDRVISTSATTRKIIRAELVNNPHSTEAKVKFAILHQRKGSTADWEDISSEPLSTLKAKECAKMELDTASTLKLFEELQMLFAIYKQKGIQFGENNLVVGHESEIVRTDAGRAKVIRALLDQDHSQEFWTELVKAQPDLANKLCLIRLLESRKEALNEFELSLKQGKPEGYWQDFFERNEWIFGFGLDYRFLKTTQANPALGGMDLTGKSSQLGDFLSSSQGTTKFTVLIEIKKPTTELLTKKEYRSHAFAASSELAGGISQLQVNCSRWEKDGSRQEQNQPILDGALTVQPKGILVIGHLNQLTQNDQKVSFELIRRNVGNPEILTFDELLERAKFIVDHFKKSEE